MFHFHLPILFGCYDQADKCSVIAKDEKFGGYSIYICNLKKRMDYGTEVPKESIGKVIAHLHFCKLESLKVLAKWVNTLVEIWEAELNES